MKKIFISSLFFLTVCGCEKFVEVDPPVNLTVSNLVFESDGTASSAITGLYANMMRVDFFISYYIPYYTGLYGDELDYRQSAPLIASLYKNVLYPKDSPTNVFWNNSYALIYQANSIFEGVKKSTKLSEPLKSQLMGEALFIRALFHYYLCNFYGDIPLITTTDYTRNSVAGKVPVAEVYKTIVGDLLEAKTLLTDKYVDGSSITESSNRFRPNTYAASALLSRVYLSLREWEKAGTEADLVIKQSIYKLESPLNIFKKNSQEAILQFELPPVGLTNPYEASYFVIRARPSATSQFRSSSLNANLVASFDNNDLRRQHWIGLYKDVTTTPNISYYYSWKFKLADPTQATTPLRLAEMYLTRAEAYAELDKLSNAIDDLDIIRVRAGISLISEIDPGVSKTKLLEYISKERQKEMFCEWGIRWFDIRRMVDFKNYMTQTSVLKGGEWNDNMAVWPFPLNEILNNKYLVQNDGYN